jgi:hypothetical protein
MRASAALIRRRIPHLEDDMADQRSRAASNRFFLIALALSAACLLAACVQSKAPLLTGTKPLFGDQFQLNRFEDFTDGKADSVKRSLFRWNGTRYAYVSGNSSDVKYVVAERLDNDWFLIEASDDKVYAYLLGHKLAEGTYRILPVDEKYLDAATQKQNCVAQDRETCTIATRAQLDAFAHASVGKTIDYTMMAVISVPTN